ncbi:hypothetical protein CAPTEDRAFT_219850 [Capitella teleta]|uniref:MICOS complex subunit n=1 Tax=Capitella teleta TaxID=283909 RepID=R7VIR6_CAPTE|nr:hypothetical protein CAPTEDRAFT_219850 [Capitella teleta]|eukprot:ELU18524.1 hypothetical protein CAPTEDRAFT_219850 [Capitella teleta]
MPSKQMLRRSTLLASSLVAPISLVNIQAAEKSERNMKASQLPLYGSPSPTQYEYIEENGGDFRKLVSKVRKAVWNYMDSMKGTTEVAKEKFEIGKAHSSNLMYRIQEDTGLLGRSVIIVVAGLGGTVLGYRSGYGRRLFYATSGMVSAAALCYPNEAVEIADNLKQRIMQSFKDVTGGQTTENKVSGEPSSKDSNKSS